MVGCVGVRTFVAEFGAVGACAGDGEARGGEEGFECGFHGGKKCGCGEEVGGLGERELEFSMLRGMTSLAAAVACPPIPGCGTMDGYLVVFEVTAEPPSRLVRGCARFLKSFLMSMFYQ